MDHVLTKVEMGNFPSSFVYRPLALPQGKATNHCSFKLKQLLCSANQAQSCDLRHDCFCIYVKEQ